MELAHPLDEGKGVAGWEEPVRALDPVAIVSALIVAQRFPTKEALLAITRVVPSVAQKW